MKYTITVLVDPDALVENQIENVGTPEADLPKLDSGEYDILAMLESETIWLEQSGIEIVNISEINRESE